MTVLYLLFKAYQPGLFDQQVQVTGHVTKRGTVVAPYQAKRKKRPEPPPAPDLFAEADRRAMEEDRKKAEEAARQEKERQEREAEAAKKEAERKAQEETEKKAKKAKPAKKKPPYGPSANRAAMAANEIDRPMTFYHGTAAKVGIDKFKAGIVFLSPDPLNARMFAESPILSGSATGDKGGGKPRVINVKVTPGKIRDISAEVDDAIFNDEDPDPIIEKEAKKALNEGFEYVKFTHPGHDGDDFFALVSAKPETIKAVDPETKITKSYLFLKAA